MLKLHESVGDYCVLFDVHDDVVTLNDSANPKTAKFYQVKTKTPGNWTTHALTARSKGESGNLLPSHLGKLYDHRQKFGTGVESLTFVSNAHLDVQMADNSKGVDKDLLCFSDIDTVELANVCTKLETEFALTTPPVGMDSTFFEATPLSVRDHETHCEGAVSAFLSRQGDGTIPPGPFHRTLRGEVQRRSTKEGDVAAFAEMVKQRGLTRAQLQNMIDSVMSQRRQDDLVALIRTQIVQEAFAFRHQSVLIGDVRKFLAQRLDRTSLILSDAADQVAQELTSAPTSVFSSARPIADTISYLSARPNAAWQRVKDYYSEGFLEAMFVVMAYEQQLPPANPQPEDENV